MEDILVPLFFFTFLGAVILVPMVLKHRDSKSRMDVLRQALERGQALDPALLEKVYETERKARPDQPRRTLGSGVVLTFLAIGLGVAGYMTDGFSPDNGMFVAAVIVGCLGLAFTLLAIIDYAAKKRDPDGQRG
jgi:uncharacterized membrane protein YcjF (UPF0283 family)